MTEPGQQSRQLAERAADPTSDEAEVMRWIDDVTDIEGWTEWTPRRRGGTASRALSPRPDPST